jgi:hypothetical protein
MVKEAVEGVVIWLAGHVTRSPPIGRSRDHVIALTGPLLRGGGGWRHTHPSHCSSLCHERRARLSLDARGARDTKALHLCHVTRLVVIAYRSFNHSRPPTRLRCDPGALSGRGGSVGSALVNVNVSCHVCCFCLRIRLILTRDGGGGLVLAYLCWRVKTSCLQQLYWGLNFNGMTSSSVMPGPAGGQRHPKEGGILTSFANFIFVAAVAFLAERRKASKSTVFSI